jgi:hypothetical protein
MRIYDQKIEWHEKAPAFSQAYSSGMEYSFVSDDYRQVHPMVYCKDFLHDAIFATVNKNKVSVYSFSYDQKKDIPIPRLRTRLAITNSSDPDFGSKIENILDLLNQVEKELKFIATTVRRCVAPPQKKYEKCGVYLFEGSKQWMMAPPMLSLFTLLLRVGACHKKGTPFKETLQGVESKKIPQYQTSDSNFLKTGMVGIERILSEKPSKIFGRSLVKNYPKGLSGGTIHNNFGIVAFSRSTTKTWCSHWHPEEPKVDIPKPVVAAVVVPAPTPVAKPVKKKTIKKTAAIKAVKKPKTPVEFNEMTNKVCYESG